MSNIINTRIQVKYDTLSAWNSSTFYPLPGEVCVAVIPNSNNNQTVGNPDSSGLSPYAVGIKVGDGNHRFSTLPWIQSIAGDVYSWAKLPSGGSIPITYNGNNNTTLQTAITGLENSIGGLVAANLSPEALQEALQQLSEQISSGNAAAVEKFASNITTEESGQQIRNYPTKLVRKIIQTGLDVTVEGDNFALEDLPFSFNTTPTIANKAATMQDINTQITNRMNSLANALHFIGITSGTSSGEPIEDGSIGIPVINGSEYNSLLAPGDIILYNDGTSIHKEFIWNGTAWELLGDEGSYALKGAIELNDFDPTLKTTLETTIANAEANVIEQINVNDTPQTITNKIVNITVPTGALAEKDSISSSDIEQSLLNKINTGIEVLGDNGYTPLTPNNATNNYRLSTIANTGSIYDVIESNKIGNNGYLQFYCGTASDVINTV